MMLRKMLVCAAVVLVALAGCESLNSPNDSQLSDADMAALRQMIDSDPLFTSEAAVLNDGDGPSLSSTLGKTTTPIIPLWWGRRIATFNRNVAFTEVNDTTVIATITHTFEGTLYIVAKYSTEDTARTVIQKPFTAETVRKAKFYAKPNKEGDDDDSHSDSTRKRWKLAEVSAVKGGAQNSQLVITRMEVTADTQTVVITDPTEYFMELNHKDRHKFRPLICFFGPEKEVTVRVTLTSADPDTDWVSVHRPHPLFAGRHDKWKPWHERMTLVSETQTASGYERVFEATWSVYVYGRHTFFVSAVTRSTLYDDQAAVSVQLWGVPYITE